MPDRPAAEQPPSPELARELRPTPEKSAADAIAAAAPSAPAYLLRGAVQATGTRAAAGGKAARESKLETREVRLDLKASLAPASLRADLPRDTQKIEPDDLIEVELESGERLWIRGDDFRLTFAHTVVARGATGEDVLDVPRAVPAASRGMATRGPVEWAIKGLKVFGVDLAKKSARAIGERVDFPKNPSNKRQEPGRIYRCNAETNGFDLSPVDAHGQAGGKPWLLFIHGTLSSTWGSFGELWSEKRKGELQALKAKYADRIIAFEHATLTQSPIENARELAAQLPANARLHLVTHSRGGLVGELLCRGRVVAGDGAAVDASRTVRGPAFTEEQLSIFAPTGGRKVDRQKDVDALRELQSHLEDKNITVDRFVRVACPALGTTLASGRLDRWLSVIGTVAGAALPGTPLADVFADIGDFIAATVKQRTDPATLPGLEAQMPDSPLIQVVNWPGVQVEGDLAVIAGDIDPTAVWARLLVWLSDRFYAGDHDLVVNTPSMWGGASRKGQELLSSHKGAQVTHFTYFSEDASARRLVGALTADGVPAGFEPLRKPVAPIARAAAERGGGGARPVLFVLPGIMGSELEDGGGSVWLALLSLLRGGLERLDIGAAGIRPTSPIARYYAEIIEHLGATHHVVPFPYDWRIKVTAEADRLAAEVRARLAVARAQKQPVRFLAHSMGGLVVRTMIARHQALWREICEHDGARLVMLGTPNGGSHAITELLVGQSAVLRKLARLDIRNSREKLLGIISRFPGILAMLPAGPNQEDYFLEDTWKLYHDHASEGWVRPAKADLKDARELRAILDGSPLDPQHMIYVAGSADVTVAGMRRVYDPWRQRRRIELFGTTRGDGRVTWDSGIPPAIPTWYMDVEHGDLAAHPPSFAAIQELLAHGTTSRLSQTAPAARAAVDLFPLPPAEDDRYPDEEDLAAAVLGAGSRKHRTRQRTEQLVQVRVVHGNLAFARYVIAVGHYAGDAIVSAEKHLDRALGEALTKRHRMGLYPGPLETNAVFTDPRCSNPGFAGLKGAIVIGLGTVGNLTAAQLARTFERALLEYALEQSKLPRLPGRDACSLGVSTLLIGTGAGGVPVADSVYALLRAVQRANETLERTGQEERIGTLELIELWEDRAIQALETLHRMSRQPGLLGAFDVHDLLDTRHGELRRLRYEEPPEWWQRLQILGGGRNGEPPSGALRFAAVTERARNEVRLLATQRELVDRFIDRALAATRDDRSVARTLFDLLLPNDLKESAPDQDNLVLLLDQESARYPWELLEDGLSDGRKPWVIEHGLLRQLEAEEFRLTVRPVIDDTALVIGDPLSSFPELPGAQAEAEAVWRTLQGSFAAVQKIRPTSEQVIGALFERPYRVLHLAGHGVYRHLPDGALRCEECGQPTTEAHLRQLGRPPRPVTGMVIGDGIFLTPAEVQQMRAVPDLVFINCCHLGRIEDLSAADRNRLALPRLAANVATEFIRMGVRAVVAAGWAVDDAAALTFGTQFYEELLDGNTFGEAVKAARRATFERHPATNTWGAYQCYGDPEYRLVLPSRGKQRQEPPPRLLSASHAVQELANIAARLKTGATDDRKEEEVARIEAIEKALKTTGERFAAARIGRDWTSSGIVLAARARAHGEAGNLDEAVRLYRQALAAEDAAVTARDIEQLANLEVRAAVRAWQEGAADQQQCTARIQAAIVILETLTGPLLGAAEATGGETSERLALLASAHKRLALLSQDEARAKALEKMEELYAKAAGRAQERGGDVAYPLLNAAAARLALRWQRSGAKKGSPAAFRAKLAQDLAALRSEVAARLAEAPTFWLYAMGVDADLLEALAAGAGSFTKEQAAAIAQAYLGCQTVASAREFSSVLEQVDFLIAMAVDPGLRERLEELRGQVKAKTKEPA